MTRDTLFASSEDADKWLQSKGWGASWEETETAARRVAEMATADVIRLRTALRLAVNIIEDNVPQCANMRSLYEILRETSQ